MDQQIFIAPVTTPLGPGFVTTTDRGIIRLDVGSERAAVRAVRDALGADPIPRPLGRAERTRIEGSIARGDGAGVDWYALPEFQRRVLRETTRIRAGRVRAYGEVAERIGAPRAARAVGTALATNPIPLLIPCHRVVRGDGTAGNYGLGGTSVKERLLEQEGAVTRTTKRSGRPAA